MSDWQPIETAPKDESVLVVYESTAANETYGEGGYRRTMEAVFEDGAWLGADCSKLENRAWRVTHWQPLPEPPVQP